MAATLYWTAMTLPPEIGPHEGIEFDLLLKGVKHVAMFTDYCPPEMDDFLKDPSYFLITIPMNFKGRPYYKYIIYRDSHKEMALELQEIMLSDSKVFDPNVERRIGQILSYSPHEIEVYLNYHANK